MLSSNLTKLIRTYSDFPKEGIIFRDIFPVLAHPQVYAELIEMMASSPICKEAEAILSVDARGFLLGSGVALKLSKPMVVARKPGKLPGDLLSQSYELEYGNDSLEIHTDAIQPYQNILIVDDLLATGGTAEATGRLISKLKGNIIGFTVLIELEFLEGRKRLKQYNVHSLVKY